MRRNHKTTNKRTPSMARSMAGKISRNQHAAIEISVLKETLCEINTPEAEEKLQKPFHGVW